MKIYNEAKTELLENPDLSMGYLTQDKLFVAHHDAVPYVPETGHWETVAEYPNGGKDVVWVVDEEGTAAAEAYDEFEEIRVYVPFTAAQLAAREIAALKERLSDTDYQAIKYAEGALSEEEYAQTMQLRRGWRARINELEPLVQ